MIIMPNYELQINSLSNIDIENIMIKIPFATFEIPIYIISLGFQIITPYILMIIFLFEVDKY